MKILKAIPLLFLIFAFSSCHNSDGKLRAPVKENGLYGYINENGTYVVEPKFQQAWAFIRGSAIVKENGKYGLIDKDGKYIVTPSYDSICPFSSECCIMEKDSMYGFMEFGTGKILLKPQFQKVFYYTDELCVVQKGKGLGLVNKDAKLVCPVVMQDFKDMFGPGAIAIQNDTSNEVSMLLSLIEGNGPSKKGIVNRKGEIMIQPKYDEMFDDLPNGFYFPFIRSKDVKVDSSASATGAEPVLIGKYGIIDTTGKIISEPIFDELPVYGEGMFRIKIGEKYGFADKTGKIVIQPAYDYAVTFSEGKAIVSIGSVASIIDKTGKKLVENLGPGSGLYRFHDGLARCRSLDGKYGFLDATGKRVIAPTLDFADDFENGRAIVSMDNRYGLIDRNGKYVVPNEYDFFYNLSDGYYQTKTTDGKAGVVDSLGNVILQPIYDEVFHLQKHFFTVEQNSLNGCYDIHGKEIFPPESSRSIYFFNGRCEVKKDDKCGIIDSTGKFIVPMQYDSIGMFYRGYATVVKGNSFGAIDSTGKILFEPKYDELRPFLNGLAVFKMKNKFGYVDLTGKIIIEAKFDEAAVLVDPDRREFE